jgi:hypothetical protein
MPRGFSEEKKQKWEKLILQQKKSGLSIRCWCQKNKVTVSSFYIWQDRLFPKSLDRSSFKELSAVREKALFNESTISIEYQGFCIHLEQCSDISALKQCLKALREAVC